MSLFHSFGQLWSRKTTTNKRLKRKAHGKRGLRIEALEDRAMLATIVVTSTFDNTNVDGLVTLREALIAANTDTSVDGSAAGSGADTITFAPSLTTFGPATFNLGIIGDNTFGPSALLITSNVTIQGPTGANGITIARDASSAPTRLRLFNVGQTGSLTLNNLTLTGGVALGGNGDTGGGGGLGAGGAIVNQGALVINASTFTGNTAQGGNGAANNFAGGGGGMGGDASGTNGGGPNGGGVGGFGGGGGLVGGVGGGGGFGGGGGGGFSGGVGGFGGGGGGFGIPGFGGGTGGQGGGGGAGLGGAIFNYGGSIDITNSTFANDAAIGGTAGGGTATNGRGLGSEIFNLNGRVFVLNSTLVTTNANSGENAIYNLGDNNVATQAGPVLPQTTAHVELVNSILNNTSGLDYTSEPRNGGSELTTGSNTFITNGIIPGVNFNLQNQLGGNPLLGVLANNGGPTQTILPAVNSSVLNAGISTANEAQRLTVGGASGTFTLTFNGATTTPLSFNPSATDIQTALNSLSTIGGVGGSVTLTQAGNVFTITFGGALAGTNVSLITATPAGGATATVTNYTQGFKLPALDQRGIVPRVLGTAVDLGATELLTGPTVLVQLVGTQLVITGDGKPDRLRLAGTANPNEFIVTGVFGTSVNGILNNAVTTAGVTSIQWNLTSGNDLIVMDNANVAGNVTIGGGSGTKGIALGSIGPVSVGGNLSINGGSNNGSIVVNRTTTVGALNIAGGLGSGTNTITMSASSAGTNLTINGGAGPDQVKQTQVTVNGLWNVNSGAGNDVITVASSVALGAAVFNSGVGADSIAVNGGRFAAGLTLDGSAGGGSKQLSMFGVTYTGVANLIGGTQNDTVTFNANAGGTAVINSGGGFDNVLVQFSILDALFAELGDGFDILTIRGSRIKGTAQLNGGAGGNVFINLGNIFEGPLLKNNL